MRVARALSLLGCCSRREGERLIAQGRVALNRRPVASPATLVDLTTDTLSVDGQPIRRQPSSVYVALHKPRGVTSTVRDPHASRTVVQLVPSETRLYPVGRLDKDSEGLIFLTNDGDFAHTVAHPRYQTEKEYFALVREPPTREALRQLRRGVTLEGRLTAPIEVDLLPHPAKEEGWMRIVLREGRNREVRRMLEAVGCAVLRLVRTRIGPVSLGGLRPGQYRALRDEEIRLLRGRSGARDPRPGARGRERPGRGERPEPHSPVLRPQSPLVVAIDGPSAAGKTTIGMMVAQRLGADFLDTGILYRALTLLALERRISPDDAQRLAALARHLDLRVGGRPSGEPASRILLGDRDVGAEIRSAEVDAHVSQVASLPSVRAALIPAQRRAAEGGPLVVAGRDIGTVIFPEAPVKIFLEASPRERARRRSAQLEGASDADEVEQAMARRDELDRTRAFAPLRRAPDAVVIETDGVPIADVVERICELAIRKNAGHR